MEVTWEDDVERQCITAFYNADKSKSLYYLRQCPNPSKVRTKSTPSVNGILFIWNITLLHIAAKNDWPDVTTKLIREYNCEPESINNRSSTPLHYAARFGSLETLRLLIEEYNCDPMRLTTNKWNALHWAASKGQTIILQYLIEVCHCNASLTDIKGHTLLHLACADDHTDTAMYLLKTGLIDPSLKDIWECTPSQWGKSTVHLKSEKPQAIELLEYFENSRLNSPVDTYTQVFVFGDKGAGKSSLVEVLKERSRIKSFDSMPACCDDDGNIKNVQLNTIGIKPENIQSKEIGNIVVYDFAGNDEYHYSHAAVMKRAVDGGLAMFILVINMSLDILSIKKQVYYWFNFVSVLCNSNKLNVLIIGSHPDLITVDDCRQKGTVIKGLLAKHYPQSNITLIPIDCRKFESAEIVQVSKNLLFTSLPLLAKSININYTCHALYHFLKLNTNKVYCQLYDLSSMIHQTNHDKFLPVDQCNLLELLQVLSKKGLILFLQQPDIANSWIIIDIDYFLHDINGILFSPTNELSSVSNIGVIPLNSIKECFPNHCPNMLSDVFGTLGICHKITDFDDDNNKCFFFPSFINLNCPSDQLPSNFDFKWILECKNHFNFFPVQFCHMLIVQIAFNFPLDSIAGLGSPASWLPQVSRRCQIWKSGLHWKTDDFIEVVVEISDNMQQVKLNMRSMLNDDSDIPSKEMLMLRSSLIKEILSVFNQCCPSLEVIEFLELDSTASSPSLESCYFFAIEDIVRTLCLRKKGVLDCHGQKCAYLNDLIPNEPFAQIPQDILIKIFTISDDVDTLTEPGTVMTPLHRDQINASFKPKLFQLKELVTFETLKLNLEILSIFNRRTDIIQNMIEKHLTVIQKSIQDTTHHEYCTVTISGIKFCSDNLPDGLLEPSHLVSITRFLKHFNKWFELGLILGLKYTTLKEIENDYNEESRCKLEMIVRWLDIEHSQPLTKLALMKALKELE